MNRPICTDELDLGKKRERGGKRNMTEVIDQSFDSFFLLNRRSLIYYVCDM